MCLISESLLNLKKEVIVFPFLFSGRTTPYLFTLYYVVIQRHKQTKGRLHADICDQLWTRLEYISEHNAHVEFFRSIAEILAKEAKELLTGEGFVAG